MKNSLKYLKDKDERTTPSYQLALQAGKKGGKNSYETVSNVIEEEKSSMIESKSEFSNKIYKEKENMSIKLSCALNDIINKNKTLLLNSFFNNTYNRNKYEKHREKEKRRREKEKRTR